MQRYIDDRGKLTIKLTSEDLEQALEEYDSYMNTKGKIWDQEWYNYPSPSVFFAIYFGGSTSNTDYHMPEEYICNSHESAMRLYEILKKIEFKSKIDGATCEVFVDKKTVHVVYTYPEVEYEFGPVLHKKAR